MSDSAQNFQPPPDRAAALLTSISRIVGLLHRKRMPFQKQLDNVLGILLEYLGVEQGSIMLLEKKFLVVAAATRAELVGKRQSIDDEGVASWVAKNRVPVFIPDISQDSRFQSRGGAAYRKNALLSVPILQADKLIGVINVTDRAGDKDLLKEDTAYLLEFSGVILSMLVQRRLQDELSRQRTTLKKRNQELHRQERMREELSRLLVHDLKAPLSEVVANLDILSYSIADENREFLEAAQIACDRTVRMLTNLVSINRMEDGKSPLSPEETDARALLEEAVSAIKGLARIKDVEIALQTPDELPLVYLDRILVLRVLQNLLTNALGYTDPSTTITTGCTIVPDSDWIEFYVEDQGPGIPSDRQVSIFDKYSRVSEKQDALVGTGLGLYFCKLAVELHKGRIQVDSAPGQGSRFSFALPI